MNAQAKTTKTAEQPVVGYAAEFPGRQTMRAVPRNVQPDALYTFGKAYKPRVPECSGAYDAVAKLLASGPKTGWELHKACQPFDPPFFGFRVRAGTFKLVK